MIKNQIHSNNNKWNHRIIKSNKFNNKIKLILINKYKWKNSKKITNKFNSKTLLIK